MTGFNLSPYWCCGKIFFPVIKIVLYRIWVYITSSHLISPQSLNIAAIPFHLSLSSAALWESPNSIPWCYLPISSSVSLLFSLSPAELALPCQGILRYGHTIWVSVSLPWLEDHHALQLHSGLTPGLSHSLCRKCSEVSYSISSQGLQPFSHVLLSRSNSHRHKGRWIRWASISA